MLEEWVMIAVRVTINVEPHRAVVLENGVDARVVDGHLSIYDVNGDAIAAFAPGQWLAFKKDERFSD